MKYNLYRANSFLYSLSVIDDRANIYDKINNIIIYNDKGILLKTNMGFFDKDLKYLEGYVVKNGICKKLKKKLDGSNFITGTECTYDTGYDLYIYYENIDYKYLGISYINEVYYQNYSIYGGKTLKIVVGYNNLKEKVSYRIDDITKPLTTYNMLYNKEEIKRAIKRLNRLLNDFEKAEMRSKEITVKDYKEFVYQSCKEIIENNVNTFGETYYEI